MRGLETGDREQGTGGRKSVALGLLALLLAGCRPAAPDQEFAAGVALLAKGDVAGGQARLEAALERKPEAPFAAEAHNWLGLANWELGQTAEAIVHFEGASKLDPAAFAPVYNLGCLCLEQGDMSRGIPLLRRAADLDPNDVQALLRIGDWTTRNGRWDLARRMYFEVQKREAQNAAALTGLGRVALLENNLPQAETFFMQALENRKDYPPALYNLGVLHAQTEGHGQQANEYFRQYLQAAPKGARAAAASDRIGGRAIEQTSFQAQASTQPKMTAGVLWTQAREALDGGDRDEAYVKTLRALELARGGGDSAQTGEILKRALEVFGDRVPVLLEAGEHEMRQSRPQEAQALLLRAQALEPGNPMVLLDLARASSTLEEYDTTVISLRQLVQVEPGNADALWELAATYGEKLGMTGKGVGAYRDFERLFPADPRAAEVPAKIQALEADAQPLPPLP
ncbi:MAG: tetratricopeptide repeat protein [Spartobacteria bacterium]|nr:tetratricopeptide repeat protein [Spartobacteria bacterium]